MESSDFAVVRVIPSNADAARRLLRRQNLPFSECDLLIVELGEGHSLSSMCIYLLGVELNIHFAYPLMIREEGGPTIALAVDDRTLAGRSCCASGSGSWARRTWRSVEGARTAGAPQSHAKAAAQWAAASVEAGGRVFRGRSGDLAELAGAALAVAREGVGPAGVAAGGLLAALLEARRRGRRAAGLGPERTAALHEAGLAAAAVEHLLRGADAAAHAEVDEVLPHVGAGTSCPASRSTCR